MGKSKPRNRVKNRDNPAGRPPADPELAALREQRILPVLKDLQSPELKARSAAARAITNIIEDTKCRKLLLREQIVKILLEQTLTDSSLDTRADGWGILRNLALEEEADFAIHLFRQDILTSIEGVVRTIVQTLESQDPPISKLPNAKRELLWNLTSSVISLLTSLTEDHSEIVEAISKRLTLINFLFGLLVLPESPIEVQNEVLSCLASLTEDNKDLVRKVVDNGGWLQQLLAIKNSGTSNSVTACGVLHNVFSTMQWFDHNTPVYGASDGMLVPTLVEAMKRASSKANGTNGHTKNATPEEVLQLALDITATIASSLQEALEHGSRYEKEFEGFTDDEPMRPAKDDDDHEMGDEEGGEDIVVNTNGEMNDDDIEKDMDMIIADGPDGEDTDSVNEDITLNNLVRSAAPVVLTLARSPSSGSSSVSSHALAALNNIAWTVSSIDFTSGHLQDLQKTWTALAEQIWKEIISPVLASNTADIELASTITGLAWAISRSMKGAVKLQSEEPQKFMALYQASKSINELRHQANGSNKAEEAPDAFQSLSVKCIGVLGSLALSPASVELNRSIGVFLITILSSLPATPAADAIEALNALYDIYADRDYAYDEPVFWKDSFDEHLIKVQPLVKTMAKGIDKRIHRELRERADEAVLNLGRFLAYKKKERLAKDEI